MQDALLGAWVRQSPFAGESLAPLHDLNHRFLDLLASDAGDWRRLEGLRFPREATAHAAALTAAQRAAAASCPYALFDLRFHDDEHWLARLEMMGGPGRVADQLDEQTAGFMRLALFYAWHIAATTRHAARLLLGMSENTAAAFRGLTLNRLLALAGSESLALTARWSESDVYWSSLLRAAACPDQIRLRRIQLFGLQLAAAVRLP